MACRSQLEEYLLTISPVAVAYGNLRIHQDQHTHMNEKAMKVVIVSSLSSSFKVGLLTARLGWRFLGWSDAWHYVEKTRS